MVTFVIYISASWFIPFSIPSAFRNLRMKVEDDPQNPARICTVWGKGYRFAAGEEGRL